MAETESSISRVYLMLGGDCNYQCRHCVQHGNHGSVRPVIDQDCLDYILRLARRPHKITVMFWGGEPLLYMDTIRMVVERLGDRVLYAMVSNGALLTGEIVEFLNEHDINFVLSNDGVNTAAVRGENLLEDDGFVALFGAVNRKAIDAVVTAYNQDYYALWDYIDSKFPGIHITTEFLQCTWDMPADLYDFDLVAYEDMMKKIVAKAHDDTVNMIPSREVGLLSLYRDEIMGLVGRINGGDGMELFPRCGQVRRSMNLDLSGNVYACHNFSDRIGTVRDGFEVLVARYDAVYSKLHDDCADCDYAMICRGGCPFVKASAGKWMCCAVTKVFIENCITYIESFANGSGR